MGIRGELFSTKVSLQNRTYFFNVKENRMGDLYLNIVESKNREGGGFERQSVILFAEDMTEFLKGFDESLRVLEKAERERRRSSRNKESSVSGKDAPRQEARVRGKPVVVKKSGGKGPKGPAKKDTPPWKDGAKSGRTKTVKAVKRRDEDF